jgi:ArsR family transcriptional regulator, arsenate/arsenite/antimonite-responsive transcriptional repressor
MEIIKVFKALSDETRLRILNILTVRDCCVCEVMKAMDISQTRASRNLQILFEAGLLRHWKEGLWSHYGIDRENMPVGVAELVDTVRRSLETHPGAAGDLARLAEIAPAGCGCGESCRETEIAA